MYSLSKGNAVSLKKTAVITAKCLWSSGTDYEVHALVLRTDGRVEHVATFDAVGVPKQMSTTGNEVRHLGDVGIAQGGQTSEEVLEIRMTHNIRAIVPVVYSAQGNGTGSFRQYGVSMEVDNGAGDRILIDARDASDNKLVYSCVPGVILNNTDDSVTLAYAALYSGMGSENRPNVVLGKPAQKRGLLGKLTGTGTDFTVEDVTVTMDAGPRNRFKAKKM